MREMKICPACETRHLVAERCPPHIDDLEEQIETLEEILDVAIDALEKIESWSDYEIYDLSRAALAEIKEKHLKMTLGK